MLEAIKRDGPRTNISVKPISARLADDEVHCERKLECLLDAAKAHSILVRIDMEDASCTQREIDLLLRLKSRGYSNVGLVLQAYLKRTDTDIAALLGARENLRICKGIYVEDREHLVEGPGTIAVQSTRTSCARSRVALTAALSLALRRDEELIDQVISWLATNV